ncbi:hypothetical protein HanPSC8_Chr08g0335971 [Helianthus annuus]|nr:hypothetical protein HanPSC8_Chr08g0335971 [Helianthus annuus]
MILVRNHLIVQRKHTSKYNQTQCYWTNNMSHLEQNGLISTSCQTFHACQTSHA